MREQTLEILNKVQNREISPIKANSQLWDLFSVISRIGELAQKLTKNDWRHVFGVEDQDKVTITNKEVNVWLKGSRSDLIHVGGFNFETGNIPDSNYYSKNTAYNNLYKFIVKYGL